MQRLAALDGLRGVAALVVLFHHTLMTQPRLASAYLHPREVSGSRDLAWWLTYSPLHSLVAGAEAVLLFFVISGWVLAHQAWGERDRAGRVDWPAYLARRLVRLLLPVIGTLALAALLIHLVPRHYGPQHSEWIAWHSLTYSGWEMLRDATLVAGPSYVIFPLWSLTEEVRFSILLPAYLWLAARRPRPWVLFCAATVLTIAGFSTPSVEAIHTIRFLPVFGIGIALALWWPGIRDRAGAWAAGGRDVRLWIPILLVGALLLTARATLLGLGLADEIVKPLAWLSVVGATLILVAGAASPRLSGLLAGPVPAWLGRVSFSLYLVHEPVLVALTQLSDSPLVWLTAGPVAALVVAHAFYRLVERPAHSVSRRVGARVSRRVTAPRAPRSPLAARR